MQKPTGMSRRDVRIAKQIIQDYFNNPKILIHIEEDSISATELTTGDEGYSRTYISVYKTENHQFYLIMNSNSADCDGRYSNSAEYLVKLRTKGKRYYMDRNWKTDKPRGEFKSKRLILDENKGRSSFRDYRAEAAGY